MFLKLLPPDLSFTSWAPSSLCLTWPFSQRCTFNWSVNRHKDQPSCNDVDEQWRKKQMLLSECRGPDERVEGGFSNQRTTSSWKTSGGAERRKWHREVRSEGGKILLSVMDLLWPAGQLSDLTPGGWRGCSRDWADCLSTKPNFHILALNWFPINKFQVFYWAP